MNTPTTPTAILTTAAAALLVLTAGCTSKDPAPPAGAAPGTATPSQSATPTPTPTPSPTPSKQQIVGKRAGEFYTTWFEIMSDPKRPVSDLTTVARGPALNAYTEGTEKLRKAGERATGPLPRIYDVQVGTASTGDEGRERIPVSVCIDATGIDQVDASGKSVKVPNRPDKFSKDTWLEQWPDGWYVMGEADGKKPC